MKRKKEYWFIASFFLIWICTSLSACSKSEESNNDDIVNGPLDLSNVSSIIGDYIINAEFNKKTGEWKNRTSDFVSLCFKEDYSCDFINLIPAYSSGKFTYSNKVAYCTFKKAMNGEEVKEQFKFIEVENNNLFIIDRTAENGTTTRYKFFKYPSK